VSLWIMDLITSTRLWARVLDTLGTSRLAAGRGWSSILKVTRGEEARSLIAHHVSLWMDGSDHLGKTVGPSPGCPRHFATRGWSSILKVTRGEEARSLIAHHVSLFDGRPRSSRWYCGPITKNSFYFVICEVVGRRPSPPRDSDMNRAPPWSTLFTCNHRLGPKY
jgi:hypothetical protein